MVASNEIGREGNIDHEGNIELKDGIIARLEELISGEKSPEKVHDILSQMDLVLGKSITLPDVAKKVAAVIESSVEKENMESVYFRIPEEDGYFRLMDGDQEKTAYSYYEIKHEAGATSGEIHYLSSEWDLEAISDLDSYFKPVCGKISGVGMSDAVRVKMLKPGRVVLAGEQWCIDPNDKMEIELVS